MAIPNAALLIVFAVLGSGCASRRVVVEPATVDGLNDKQWNAPAQTDSSTSVKKPVAP